MAKPKLGATGRHPLGRVTEDDEGEIRIGIAVHSGRVLLDFGKPVWSLGFDSEGALDFARSIKSNALKAKKQEREMMETEPAA